MKQQKNGRQNYDWEKIKLDYISDPSSSLKKISEKYKIRLHTVEKRSSADNWFQEKKDYQQEMSSEITSRVFAAQADALEKELVMVDKLTEVMLRVLEDDPLQFQRHIVYQNGSQQEVVFTKNDTQAMLNMTKSIKQLVEIKCSILGLTSREHRDRIDIAREKLELERERLEWEKEKAEMLKPLKSDGDKPQIGIVILPEVIDKNAVDTAENAVTLK